MNSRCCDGCGCLSKCFISRVFDEGGYLHCQEGNYHSSTHIHVDPSHPGLQSDCDLMDLLFPFTNAQRLTWGYCGLRKC